MTNVDSKGRTGKRILIYGAVAVSLLVAAAAVAQAVWVRSGSSQWELEMDENGVQIYSMKSPGVRVKKYKSVLQVRAKQSAIVKMLEDPDVCGDVGCRDSKVELVDERLSYHSFVIDPPFPFQSREFLARQEISQDPATKALIVEYVAAPDRAPANECCYRVQKMHNTWRFTPIEDGKLQVEYILDADEGGAIPGFVLDSTRVPFLRTALFKLEGLLNRPQYQDAQYRFLTAES